MSVGGSRSRTLCCYVTPDLPVFLLLSYKYAFAIQSRGRADLRGYAELAVCGAFNFVLEAGVVEVDVNSSLVSIRTGRSNIVH